MAKRAHRTRSRLEAAVCEEMERQAVPHEHRSLRYRVVMASGKVAKYQPAIIAHRGPLLFLVEPCRSHTPGGGAVERHTRFLDQHSPELIMIVVAPERVADRLPPESYDELYPEGDVAKMVRRIREQDPKGTVRPFAKPRRVTGSS